MANSTSPGATAKRDLQSNASTGELEFANGDLIFTSGLDAIRQSLVIRLAFFLGEWFLDTSAGADWPAILGRKFSPDQPLTIARKAILETPGVSALGSLTADYIGSTRVLEIHFEVSTDFGQLTGSTKAIV
jgi:hypothetical protein